MPAQDLIIDLAIRYGFQVVGALVILIAVLMVRPRGLFSLQRLREV